MLFWVFQISFKLYREEGLVSRGTNSVKWLNYLVPHTASRLHFIDKISVKFICPHAAFCRFYKSLKILLVGTDLFWGTKSMKELNYWISLNEFYFQKFEAARFHFIDKISAYFAWLSSAFESFLYFFILPYFLGADPFLIKG